MQFIEKQLHIVCVSHFRLSLQINVDCAIDFEELPSYVSDSQALFDELLEKFNAICTGNGFKNLELYSKYATFKDGSMMMWLRGDLHEPFTPYLEEKLKAVMTVTR